MKKYLVLFVIAVASICSCSKNYDGDAGMRMDENGRTQSSNGDAGMRMDENGRTESANGDAGMRMDENGRN